MWYILWNFPPLKKGDVLITLYSKLGMVLEIEAAESYIKRPTGPMVTVEVPDITKLAGFIRIPLMAEGAPTTNSVR